MTVRAQPNVAARPPAGPRPLRWLAAVAIAIGLLAGSAWALKPSDRFTLEDLQGSPKLTPGDFADLFAEFEFAYFPRVQAPNSFLRGRVGDCDDYAILADHVLSQKGFKTRIIQVRMVGLTYDHAVCYVDDKRVYLDYNNRKYSFNLQRAKPYLRDIAEEVADSLERNWTAAFEFTYSYVEGRKKTRFVVVKTEDPDRDPDRLARAAKP